jgi:hypothetical protein
MLKKDPKKSDQFLADAQKIYDDLYSVDGMKAPKAFIEHLFTPTKSKLHSSKVSADKLSYAIHTMNGATKKKHYTGVKKGEM